MTTTQRIEDLSPRTKLRLSEIERLIRTHRIIVPVPSRRALVELCEDGTFETAPRNGKLRRTHWLVFEDSFLSWIENLNRNERPE